jgi:hypothetical protein
MSSGVSPSGEGGGACVVATCGAHCNGACVGTLRFSIVFQLQVDLAENKEITLAEQIRFIHFVDPSRSTILRSWEDIPGVPRNFPLGNAGSI